ncbi:type II toxin-antitoxin system VapC family toxin [Kineosporia sp. A_224]|uniref:type II toxin-antitoxin system VapC family toxin n=1 Tax=Kineosporia sp. A_224 TaxID=1962180 RepID=UPI000B4C0330|nr:type II toxin-antitoxin system VapC family toxin [Kineosporia sp. A_224]
MRLLLDTHVVLWWLTDDETLADETKDLIDTETEVFISAASVWEIAIKQASGKLTVPTDLLQVIDRSGLVELPVRSRHAVEAGGLPAVHRDPFDRMLVAQARCEGLTLLTRDPLVLRYDVALREV